MDNCLIKYNNVNIRQDGLMVLEDINIELNAGDYVYIIGKVGTGKSSFLKTVYAELKIDSGEASVLGFDLNRIKQKDIPALRRKLGIVFQDFQLLTDRNVHDNLMFVLKATGWKDKREIEERINEVLVQVGMQNKGYKMPNELSGGEQQRIVIARAILNKPEILIADEPTGNLDVETTDYIVGLLHSIADSGTLVVMTTHNLNIIDKFPGKVYVCENHSLKNKEFINCSE